MTSTGVSRIGSLFALTRAEGRAALLPYLTAGIPSIGGSVDMFEVMADAGADGFELGIPYADPLMDGPVIAAAAARALEGGTTVKHAFGIAERTAASTGKPIILMTYTNPVVHYGIDRFAADAASAGAAGLIIADLPVEEAAPFIEASRSAGLGMALFAAPTTTDERLDAIVEAHPSFIYGVASLGVTGERARLSESIANLSSRIRSRSGVPLIAGVGISTPGQAAMAARSVDGVIVGSAIVRRVLEASDTEAAASSIAAAVRDFAKAVRG